MILSCGRLFFGFKETNIMELMVGFVGDADQQQRHGGGMLLQIILCDKPTGDFLRMRTLFQRTSARATCSKNYTPDRYVRTQQKQHSLVSMRTSTHQTLWDPWGNPCDFFLPSRFVTEEGWPLQDVGEVGNGCGPWVGAVGIRWSRVLASGSSVEGVKMLYDLNRESGHIYLLIKDIYIYIY